MLVAILQGGPLHALLARPFSLPATALLVSAKFATNAAVVVVEHVCSWFYAIPSFVVFPLALGILVWQFRDSALAR